MSSIDEVSVSQVNTSLDCLRRWGLEKIDGVRYPGHRSARAGQRIHEILEQWLKKATPPDVAERLVLDGTEYLPGLVAFNGLHMLPPPGPDVRVEFEFNQGLWNGRIDWALTRPDGTPVVGDHKTTGSSSFEYAQTEESLRTDVQAVVYAFAVLSVFPKAPHVDLFWCYYNTRKPYRTRRVAIRLTREEVALAIRLLNVLAERLIQIRRTPGLRGVDLPVSPAACEKYGGCPHKNFCNLSPEQRMGAYMTDTEPSLEAKMAQALNGTATILAPPPAITPTWPPEGWALHTTPGYLYKVGTQEWASEADLRARSAPPPVIIPMIPAVVNVIPTVEVPPAIPTIPVVVVAPSIPVVQVQQAASQLPPVIPFVPGTPLPNGLVAGEINSPEGRGLPQRAEPLPEVVETPGSPAGQGGAPAGVQDDLTAVEDRDALAALGTTMGLAVKGIRLAGLKDMIRAARAAGAPIIAVPVKAAKPPAVQPGTNHAPPVGTMPSGTPVVRTGEFTGSPEGADYAVQALDLRRDRITTLVSSMISARSHGDDEQLVRSAISINELIERLSV